MSINFSDYPLVFEPELLSTGYTAGDVLFTPVKINNLNLVGLRPSTLHQLGIFWDIASAPEIELYFFNSEPETWGEAGDAPAPSFADRAKLIAELEVSSADEQGYETLIGDNGEENSYLLFTGGALGVFKSIDETGYITALIKTDHSGDLEETLKLTFIVRKST